jgi:hypothetical protein
VHFLFALQSAYIQRRDTSIFITVRFFPRCEDGKMTPSHLNTINLKVIKVFLYGFLALIVVVTVIINAFHPNELLLTSIDANTTAKVKHQIAVKALSNNSRKVDDFNISCTWVINGSSGCRNMLNGKLLIDASLNSNTSSPAHHQIISRRWVFIGDSTMAFLFHSFNKNITSSNPCGCSYNKAPRCDMYDAFGLTKKKDEWNPPREGHEGPYAHGLHNPHCQDCLNCESYLVQCQHFHPCNNGTTLSFLGIHFSRDVEMQTEEGTNTTQESIVLSLKQQEKCLTHPFICVLNTGFHDMRILPEDGELYIHNVEWYVTLLQPCCIHLIWVQMTSVLEDGNYPQRNYIIESWNAKVHALLLKEQFRNWTSIIDPYNASKFDSHRDNVHLSAAYYKALSNLFSPYMLWANHGHLDISDTSSV